MPKRITTCALSLVDKTDLGELTVGVNGRAAPASTIAEWTVEWDDGEEELGVGALPAIVKHAYLEGGTKLIVLTVRDSKNKVVSQSMNVFIVRSTGAVVPILTVLSPSTGVVGSACTLTGLNFGATQGTSFVRVNGLPATVTSWAATSIDITIPTGATTGSIVVTVSGLASNGMVYTVTGGVTGDWFVATTGSDSNAGTVGSPFATINKAYTLVSAGQTIVVEDGTYTISAGVTYSGLKCFANLVTSGTAGNPITIRARNRGLAILEGNSNERDYGFAVYGNYWKIQGFEIRNVAADGILANTFGGTDLTIKQCWIHHVSTGLTSTDSIGRNGVFSQHHNTIVEQCTINDIGRTVWSGDHGLYCKDGENWIIRNNIFYNNSKGWHIQLYDQAMSSGKIYNNTFAFPCSVEYASITSHLIFAAPLTTWDVANNIFYQPTASMIYPSADYSYSGVTVRTNLTTVSSTVDPPTAGFSTSGNLVSTDPLLVDTTAPTYDWHTNPGPARGAGLTLADVTEDYAGNPRTVPYDIGAYQA